ncbi:MAG: GNAT family N-acetyltransferase [Anaerolineales bacterium]|nr:MAG: GNAT family N-acetyltransferase [Anaerolineales bacterium]
MLSQPRPPDQSVIVQPATWRDLRPLLLLEKICFGRDVWSLLDTLAALTYPQTVRLKAIVDGRVVGFIIGDRRRGNNLGWIASLGVHPDYRRRGIARSLLAACEGKLAMPRIRLTLRSTNEAALCLYQQMSYVEIDIWKRYYRRGEDAIVMEKVR